MMYNLKTVVNRYKLPISILTRYFQFIYTQLMQLERDKMIASVVVPTLDPVFPEIHKGTLRHYINLITLHKSIRNDILERWDKKIYRCFNLKFVIYIYGQNQ